MEKLTVIKVGGGVLENAKKSEIFLDNFVKTEGLKILIHGGGRSATRLAERLGVETKMIEGRRVTDESMIEIVKMVYGGLVNKTVVAGLQKRGVNSIGLTGADSNLIISHRRPIKNGIDYGYVGDIDSVNCGILKIFLNNDIVPVIAPLTVDQNGEILNTNADTIASEVAGACSSFFEVNLIYCFEKPGVLADADDEKSVIPRIDYTYYETLKTDGIINGGMIPKLENAFKTLQRGVKQVVITDYLHLNEGGTIVI